MTEKMKHLIAANQAWPQEFTIVIKFLSKVPMLSKNQEHIGPDMRSIFEQLITEEFEPHVNLKFDFVDHRDPKDGDVLVQFHERTDEACKWNKPILSLLRVAEGTREELVGKMRKEICHMIGLGKGNFFAYDQKLSVGNMGSLRRIYPRASYEHTIEDHFRMNSDRFKHLRQSGITPQDTKRSSEPRSNWHMTSLHADDESTVFYVLIGVFIFISLCFFGWYGWKHRWHQYKTIEKTN